MPLRNLKSTKVTCDKDNVTSQKIIQQGDEMGYDTNRVCLKHAICSDSETSSLSLLMREIGNCIINFFPIYLSDLILILYFAFI